MLKNIYFVVNQGEFYLRPRLNRWIELTILISVFSILSACTVVSNKPYIDKDRVIIPPSSASVSALLEKAYQYQLATQYQQTLSTLERAIRIEPGDPVPWYRGAEVHFSRQDYDQSLVFAQRAASLSSAYASLRRGCWRLISKNHQALGQLKQAKLADQKAKTI